MADPKLFNDICLVSRHVPCLLDMKQVAETAKRIGLSGLAELVEQDLNENKVLNGQYFPVLKTLFGMQS